MSRGRRIARIKLVPPSQSAADKYLLEWDNRSLYHHPEKFPLLTPENLFQAQPPMTLEIGCGSGEFLISSASAAPDNLFVGVEISRRAIYHAVILAEKTGLENIKFIKADIRLLYPLMKAASWSMIHLNYPDPNFSSGRKKHRIFDSQFLDTCFSTLIQNGKISVVTDQRPFLEDMLEVAEEDIRFVKTHENRYLEGVSPAQKTRFQQTWERFQRPNYIFELQKKS